MDVLIKSRTIHHSNEALNLNKWQTNNVPLTRVTDFISTSESLSHTVIGIYDDDMLGGIDINTDEVSFQEQRPINLYSVYIKQDMRLSVMKSVQVNKTEVFVKAWDILGSVGPSLIETCHGNALFSDTMY